MRVVLKEFFEYCFWKATRIIYGPLNNNHFKYFYTDFFSITEDFYQNKKILDIGCGPRGSLEWADMAKERNGLDPLAEKYKKLWVDKQKMKYVKAYAENMPFENETFDVVSSFNSIDHVDDINKVCAEIKRVLVKDGLLLLIVNVHNYKTFTEPHPISWDFLTDFFPDFEIIQQKRLAEIKSNKIYVNLRLHIELLNTENKNGILAAVLKKNKHH